MSGACLCGVEHQTMIASLVMANRRLSTAEKFLFGYPLLSAIRKACSIVVALACLGYLFGEPKLAIFGAFGALCLSMMDLPGSPRQVTAALLIGSGLALASASLTAMTAPYPAIVTAAVTLQSFFFSLLVVYGKRGATTGIGCMILTLVAMYAANQGADTAELILSIAAGLGIYTALNIGLAYLLLRWEQAQSLSMALYATARYLKCRARALDPDSNLDKTAHQTIAAQAVMAEMHQSARDMIFSPVSNQTHHASPRHNELAQVLYQMVSLHDMLLGSYADYKLLHQTLGKHDILTLSCEALDTLADQLDWVALAVGNHKPAREHHSITPQLEALHQAISDLELQTNSEVMPAQADLMPIVRQLQHRLITGNAIVRKMMAITGNVTANSTTNINHPNKVTSGVASDSLPPFPSEMLSRQSFSPRLLLTNLRLDSPPFRFALRVSIAVMIGLLTGLAFPDLGAHAYWIVLTIIIIMKPAFALTKQRNHERLTGTLMGCLLALGICTITANHWVYGVVAAVSLFLIPSFILMNYRVAVVLITLLVLLSLQLVLPNSTNLIAERGLDTLIGSVIALACSRILPWWEAKSLPDLAQALMQSNSELLAAAIEQIQAGHANTPMPRWSLAKRNTLLAYSNFANALYRMTREPKSQQKLTQTYNDLLVASHVVATEISTLVYFDQRSQTRLPDFGLQQLKEINQALKDNQPQGQPQPQLKDNKHGQRHTALPDFYAQPLEQLKPALERTLTDFDAIKAQPKTNPTSARQ